MVKDIHGFNFTREVNVVDDLGIANDGTDPIGDTLEGDFQDGTIYLFPGGDYRRTGRIALPSDMTVGFMSKAAYDAYADGDDVDYRDPDATYPYGDVEADDADTPHIVPDSGVHTHCWDANVEDGYDVLIEGFVHDVRGSGDRHTGWRPANGTNFTFEVRNCRMEGRGTNSSDQAGATANIIPGDGDDVRFHRVRIPKHSDDMSDKRRVGFLVPSDAGNSDIWFVDCEVGESSNNGIYAGHSESNVRVIGGDYHNNAMAQVRISGRSRCEGTTIRVDDTVDISEHALTDADGTDDGWGTRMFWQEANGRYDNDDYDGEPTTIQDCDFFVGAFPDDRLGIIEVIGSACMTYDLDVINTTIDFDIPDGSGDSFSPTNILYKWDAGSCLAGYTGSDDPRDFNLENVAITGSLDGQDPTQIAEINDADGSVWDNFKIDLTNDDDNIEFIQDVQSSVDVTVRNYDIQIDTADNFSTTGDVTLTDEGGTYDDSWETSDGGDSGDGDGGGTTEDVITRDFGDETPGTPPSDTTAEWGTADGDFTIRDVSSPVNGRVIELEADAGTRRALSLDTVGTVQDTDIIAVVKHPDYTESNAFCRLITRGDGTDGAETGYFTSIYYETDTSEWKLRIGKYDSGSYDWYEQATLGDTADKYQLVRFNAAGSTLRAKLWPFGQDQPDTWDVERSDSGLVEGFVGIGGFSGDAQQWDYLSVGVGGADAELPTIDSARHVTQLTDSGASRTVDGVTMTLPIAIDATTADATNVGETTADVGATLDTLDGYFEADASVEYREVGSSTWDNETVRRVVTEGDSETWELDSLGGGTEYEHRARIQGLGEGSVVGTATEKTFTTTSTVAYIDEFNDTDFSEWNGDTGQMTQVSNPLGDGREALDIDGDFNEVFSEPGDGLANYFAKGNTFRAEIATSVANDAPDIRYAYDDANNNYFEVEFEFASDDLVFIKNDGSTSVIDDTTFSDGVTVDTWYYLVVTWDDGTLGGDDGDHTIDVEDADGNSVLDAPIEVNDTALGSNEGVRITNNMSSGTSFYVDDLRLI